MRLRDATRSKVNLVLLKYVNETNCKWLSKIGVSPANYLKATLAESTGGASISANANPAINLSTDQLVRMIDPKYETNVIQELFKQLTAQMYTHHSIFRIHKHKVHQAPSGPDADSDEAAKDAGVSREHAIQGQVCDVLSKDRQAFYGFCQDIAIDLLSQLLANNLQTSARGTTSSSADRKRNMAELMKSKQNRDGKGKKELKSDVI